MARGVGGRSTSNVQSYLKGVRYPAQKADLLKAASGNGAPGEVMQVLEKLGDRQYGGPQEVMKSYGEERKAG